MAVNGGIVAQHVPEPALAVRDAQPLGPVVGRGLHCGEKGIARVIQLEVFKLDGLGCLAGFGKNDLCLAVTNGCHHAGAVVRQKQDAGQNQAGNFIQFGTKNNAPREPRLARRPQACLGRHLVAREPGHKKLRAHNLAAQTQQNRKAAQQARHKIHVRGAQGPHGTLFFSRSAAHGGFLTRGMGYGVHGGLADLTGGPGRTVCCLLTDNACGIGSPASGGGRPGSGFGGSLFDP